MALRNQPYIPLYVQDIMTDEKLNECSASTHGIYIKGIMCLMHKSETYGKLLLKQKYKQSKKQSRNFACQLVKHLPYSVDEIDHAIDELIEEKVCYYDSDYLCQKRMIRDNDLSIKRASAGKKGGDKTGNKFALAKDEANTEYRNEDVSSSIIIGENNLNELLNSFTMKESAAKLTGLSVKRIDSLLELFIIEQRGKDNLHRSLKELRSHFVQWVKFNKDKLKSKTFGTVN